jgi:hypothetical protein
MKQKMQLLILQNMILKRIIVRIRMWYADIRGHHGKRWNYEPGDWYMGRHKKKR